MADAEEVFRFARCHGRIFLGTTSWSVAFDLTYSAEGAIHFSCSDLPVTAETLELMKVYLSKSGNTELFRLDARDGDSNHITNDVASRLNRLAG